MIPRLGKECYDDCQLTVHVDAARSHVPLTELYGNRPQLPSSIGGLLSINLLKGISKRKLFPRHAESGSCDSSKTESTRETESARETESRETPSFSFDDNEPDIAEESSPMHDDEQLKIAGFKWISADSGKRYVQLNFVPQETIVLVRRAPVRQRSLIRQLHRQSSSSSISNHSQKSIVIVGERPAHIQGRTQNMDSSHHSLSRRHATRQAKRLSKC